MRGVNVNHNSALSAVGVVDHAGADAHLDDSHLELG